MHSLKMTEEKSFHQIPEGNKKSRPHPVYRTEIGITKQLYHQL